MSKVVLNIRETNQDIFDLIKSGEKTIETRAATKKFADVAVGDILIFKCCKNKLEKKVIETYKFGSIDQLLRVFKLEEIMPHIKSKKEAVKVWYSFPGYKEKIKKHGIVAFKLK